MSRRALRATALAAPLLCGGCSLLAIPIQLLRLILEGVFRLGNAAIQGLGSLGQSVAPYLLFFTMNDAGSAPGAGELEAALLAAGRERPVVEVGLDQALRSGPAGADGALLVPLEAVLEPGGTQRIARCHRGRRLLGVTFAWLPDPDPSGAPRIGPPGSPPILELAPRTGSSGG